MNRAMKNVIAGAGLMLALSAPVYAENGTSGMTGPASGGNTANAPGYTTTNSPVNGTRLGVTVPQDYTTGGERGTTANRSNNANYTTRTGGNGAATGTNNNAYRRYSVNSAGVGNNNMTSQRLRAQAANADNDMDWGWLGLLGLLGLAGLRNRNRETS